MTDPIYLLLLAAALLLLGFQTGCITSWRFYKRQREEQDAIRREYEARIVSLRRDLEYERQERRWLERSQGEGSRPVRQTESYRPGYYNVTAFP